MVEATDPAVSPDLPTSLFDVYRWLRSNLDVASRRALRECSKAAQSTHDREEASIHAKCSLSRSDKLSVTEISNSISGILRRGCRPDRVSLLLDQQDTYAQSRGIAALACFPAADVGSVTQLAVQRFNLTAAAATAAAAAAPRLASLQLVECVDLGSLPLLVASTRYTLCHLSLGGCGSWPGGVGDALATCPNLEHLTVLLPAAINSATHTDTFSSSGLGPIQSDDSAAAVDIIPFVPVCSALTQLTQLRSLTMELKLPSYGDENYEGTRAMAAAKAAASLAHGISALTRLSRLEVGDGGALPHPDWRMELLHSLAGLPRLGEMSWRRLECDPEVSFALSSSSSLTSLSVEKFCTVAPVTAVALAAAATAAAEAEMPAANATGPGSGSVPLPRALASAAVAAANGAAASAMQGTGRPTGRGGGDDGGGGGNGGLFPSITTQKLQQQHQQQLKLLLLPLPPRLRVLRARYSGLGGVSLAALAALQLPPALTSLELRNPKLEIGDGDVNQPSAARLLPEAALALGMGLSKLATHCPDLQVLRIINETRQRYPVAGPFGWEEVNGGDDGAAGGGHTPWMVNLGKLRHLKRLTLSGLRLGRVDAEALARHLTSLEELYLVPLGSVSSAAVMVFRSMKLRRLSLPFDRHG
ncbi:hypothetical protein Vafri_4407 [Volvox africanus]|uniref:Uncharacterized protein n=2 Tax=Volvox africanus TaxID=51714 RepID=A0A8J4AY80_9CHLO|nr:hypothetical protein Vafri_4407 [Volvox africanus]